MSSLAVFLVLGGATAFAATKIGANELKANSVLTGKIKKEAITTSKIKNSAVSTAKIADKAVTGAKIDAPTLGTVPSATSAATATTSEGPTAFAHVSSSGAVLDSRGGVTVTVGTSSYYCISGLSSPPKGLTASPDYWNGTGEFQTQLQVGLASAGGLGGTGCPAGTQAFVHGVRPSTDVSITVAFYVILFK